MGVVIREMQLSQEDSSMESGFCFVVRLTACFLVSLCFFFN